MGDEQPASPAAPAKSKRDAALLLAIFLLALGVRLAFVLATPSDLQFPDEKQYLNIAENYVAYLEGDRNKGLVVSIDSDGDEMHYPLYVQRAPVYPLMLAFFERMHLGLIAVRIAQAVIGAATCVLIAMLAKELAGRGAGIVAGFIAAIYPFFIYFTGRMLSETLFLFFFVGSFVYITRAWNQSARCEKTTRWMASLLVGAFLAGAAVLTRSEALAVYLPAPLVWLAFGPKRLVGLASGVALLAVMLLVMSPWVVRNYKATTYLTGPDAKPRGRFVLTTLKVGESLYEAVGPLAIGGPNKHLWSLPSDPEFTRGDEYEQNRYLLKISLEYMKSQPMRALRLALVKFRRTWNVVPNYENAQTPFYRIVSLASYVPVLVTGLLGLFVVAARRGRALGWILLPIVVMTTVHMVFVGSVRYRLPMMPFVMVLSGAAVWWLACKLLKVAPETAEN